MSLVSVNTFNQKPILCGDILISQEFQKNNISIPTIDDPSKVLNSENRAIVSLVQKLLILSDNICLGWVGDQGTAHNICTSLKNDIFDDVDRDYLEMLLGLFDDIPVVRHTKIFIIIHKSESFEYLLWDSCNPKELETIIAPFAMGSGKNHFYILEEAKSTTIESEGDYISKAINHANLLHSNEIAFRDNIKDFWGGFIQTIIHDGNKFRFLDNYLSFFIGIEKVENNNLSETFFPYAFRPHLIEDLYIIERFKISPKVDDPDYYGVPNIVNYIEKAGRYKLKPTNFKPSYYSISMMYINELNKPSPMCLTFPESSSANCISCTTDSGISFYMYPEFMKNILKLISKNPDL